MGRVRRKEGERKGRREGRRGKGREGGEEGGEGIGGGKRRGEKRTWEEVHNLRKTTPVISWLVTGLCALKIFRGTRPTSGGGGYSPESPPPWRPTTGPYKTIGLLMYLAFICRAYNRPGLHYLSRFILNSLNC